eukprot:TRINITY_DN63_c0_g1_i2.p1 TRINITY_DN63_c0_g1~~TRINITY_DN63_c0_g1_i2.p1  ORF type:complete len:220 (-),score=33.30 TRINITY_DN63_c0_g1_i2:788-1447(-)
MLMAAISLGGVGLLPRIILGSSSRTRMQILTEMGISFEIQKADIDEKAIRREKPEDLVMALAHAKADAIITKLRNEGRDFPQDAPAPTVLLTADQVVVHKGAILEKPATEAEARRFIQGYSDAPAVTVGSVLATNLNTGKRKGGLDCAKVCFHPIPKHVINTLVEGSDVYYCAGGLMVEHPLVSPLISAMVGTIDSVMGLPKVLTLTLLQEVVGCADTN